MIAWSDAAMALFLCSWFAFLWASDFTKSHSLCPLPSYAWQLSHTPRWDLLVSTLRGFAGMLPVFSFQVQLYQRVDLAKEQAVFYVAYVLDDVLLYMFVIHRLPPLNFSFTDYHM